MTALLVGYYGVRNLGDEMMLYCLSRWLGAQGIATEVLAEDARYYGQSGDGFRAIQNVPLLGEWGWYDAWFRGSAWRLVGKLKKYDLVIGGGGDCIRDDLGGWRQFAYSVEKYVLALLLGRKIALLNVGLGMPRRRLARRILAWLLKRSSRTVVRDGGSLETTRALGATGVFYAPDIVLSMARYVEVPPEPSGRPYVLVCLRAKPGEYRRFSLSGEMLQALAGGLDGLIQRHDMDVVFVPFQAYNAELDDNAVHGEIFNRMERREHARVLPWSGDLARIAGLFAHARLVLAMRLHAAILAAGFGRPCVVMPYDRKVVEFREQAGIRYTLDPGRMDSADSVSAVLDECLRGPLTAVPQPPPDAWDRIAM